MDVMDDQAVITVDILGAFLQGDWRQDEHPAYIMFEGLMVNMICEIDPSCFDKVQWNKQRTRKFLYAQLVKAVYGTVFAAIIFYNKLSKHLIEHGFAQEKKLKNWYIQEHLAHNLLGTPFNYFLVQFNYFLVQFYINYVLACYYYGLFYKKS